MAAGYTCKPCHGCGSTKEHKIGEVCAECLTLFEIAKLHKENYIKLVSDEDFVEIKVPYSWERPQYFTKRSMIGNVKDNLKYERVGEILRELSEELSFEKGLMPVMYTYHGHLQFQPHGGSLDASGGKLDTIYGKKSTAYGDSHHKTAVMPKNVRILLDELHLCIRDSLLEVEEQSVAFGKNAMLMLNAGHLTLNEFEDK